MEFGTGVIPEELLSFEDAKKETIQVRALEMQKLGISDTDRTVTSDTLGATQRDDAMPVKFGDFIPAFVEIRINDRTEKVEIVPVESIPELEGARCIAFYSNRYRLAWDAWDEGEIYLWFDPIEDLSGITGKSGITFPQAFWTLLVKKTALNLIKVIRLKALHIGKSDREELNTILSMFEKSLNASLSEWEQEFFKWRNIDFNAGPRLRRTNEEIMARAYNNVTGRVSLDG